MSFVVDDIIARLVAQYIKSSSDANFVYNRHDNVSLIQGFFIVLISLKLLKMNIACDTKTFLSFPYLFPSVIETLSVPYIRRNFSVSKRKFNIEKLFGKEMKKWKTKKALIKSFCGCILANRAIKFE